MSNDVADDEPQTIDEPGWRVLDPDGTVVDSGPGIALEMVAHIGEEQ
ncbi:MAG: hypothetical protein JWO67_2575 [Streptosporangiaceae bacterium]|nr:hypothetical protein [Streptosporangiaceae bacterium]